MTCIYSRKLLLNVCRSRSTTVHIHIENEKNVTVHSMFGNMIFWLGYKMFCAIHRHPIIQKRWIAHADILGREAIEINSESSLSMNLSCWNASSSRSCSLQTTRSFRQKRLQPALKSFPPPMSRTLIKDAQFFWFCLMNSHPATQRPDIPPQLHSVLVNSAR